MQSRGLFAEEDPFLIFFHHTVKFLRIQLQKKNGWFINHLMLLPEAPNGTFELLFTTVLEPLQKEGFSYASVGMIASKELGEIDGLDSFSCWAARRAFKVLGKFLNLERLNAFWGKFDPKSELPYLVFSRNKYGFLRF